MDPEKFESCEEIDYFFSFDFSFYLKKHKFKFIKKMFFIYLNEFMYFAIMRIAFLFVFIYLNFTFLVL